MRSLYGPKNLSLPACLIRSILRTIHSASTGTRWRKGSRSNPMPGMITGAIQRILEFLVRPHGVFIGGYLSAPLAVVKVLKKLNLRCVQAAMAFTGGPVERKGPDFRRVSGNRRKASKFRKRAASASLTSPGVSVAASHRGGSGQGSAARLGRSAEVRAI